MNKKHKAKAKRSSVARAPAGYDPVAAGRKFVGDLKRAGVSVARTRQVTLPAASVARVEASLAAAGKRVAELERLLSKLKRPAARQRRIRELDVAKGDVARLTGELAAARTRGEEVDVVSTFERELRERGGKVDEKKMRRAFRRRDHDFAAAEDAAGAKGAALPPRAQAMRRSWQVEVVDTPVGSIAKPAYVVRIDSNAPLGRLSRPARPGEQPALGAGHVKAAEQVIALYCASLKNAKMVATYDGMMVDGGGAGKARGIEVACESYAKLSGAMAGLLPVEQSVVMEVCVYETPIEALAQRKGVTHMRHAQRSAGAVIQTLRCGLERLANAWGVDVAVSHNVDK